MVDGVQGGVNKKTGVFLPVLSLCTVAIYCITDFIQ